MFASTVTLSIARSALRQVAVGILFFWLVPCSIMYAAASPEDAAKIESLIDKFNAFYQAGKFAEAIPIAQECLNLQDKALGPGHLDTAHTAAALAFVYHQTGNYAKAEPLYHRTLSFGEKTLGPDRTAQTLNNLADVYRSLGDYAKAEPLFQRSVDIVTKNPGGDAQLTATTLSNYGVFLTDHQDEHAKAEPFLVRALQIREKALDREHPDTAISLHLLAALYASMGQHLKAEPLYQRAVEIREKALGRQHPDTAHSRNKLAEVKRSISDAAEAEVRRKRGSEITLEEIQKVQVILERADKEMKRGDYLEALKTYQGVLPLVERTFGPEHDMTVSVQSMVGSAFAVLGDYAQAEPYLRRGLEHSRKRYGDDHRYTGITLWQIGILYMNMHDWPRAEEAIRKVVQIARREFPGNWKHLAMSSSLALVTAAQGKDDAKALAEEALALFEAYKSDDPSFVNLLHSFAVTLAQLDRIPEALQILERKLKSIATVQGSESLDRAKTHQFYGALCLSVKRFAEAAEHSERALAITQKHPSGSDITRSAANTLAKARLALKEPEAARLAARSGQEATEKFLANLLSFTSEQQRLTWAQKDRPHDMLATLADADGLARSLLRLKGLVLDSILEDRAVAAEANVKGQTERLRELSLLKRRLFENSSSASTAGQNPSLPDPAALREKIERLESSMARSLSAAGRSRRALEVKTEQIQTALPGDSALVEFVRYHHAVSGTSGEARYGAIIISKTGKPLWVALGSAREMEKELSLYRKSVRGFTDEETLIRNLRGLYDRIWAPIEAALGLDVKTVMLAPDGELNFISFATLLGLDNRFVGQKYSLRYFASGRDLLRPAARPKKPGLLVFADPAFGRDVAAPSVAASGSAPWPEVGTRDLVGFNLPSLPGTSEEAAALLKRSDKSRGEVQAFTGPDATEKKLKEVTAPRILHLATHGFFLPEITLAKADELASMAGLPPAKLANPMYRSGLALTGAQRTLEAWQRGQVPASENDGIVTAEEVGSLNLNGTWLVVLSACDTGSGEARAGEGVMGLRRGFAQAGAQNLLLTLWPISDAATVQIMLDFYDVAEKTKNAPQALADVQRDWLVKLRKERGLQAAVQLAGPFIMSSQGQP